MKKKPFRIVFGVILGLAFTLTACATKTNLVKEGTIQENIIQQNQVRISLSSVYEEDHRTILSGTIRRRWGYRTPLWGHIDLSVLAQQKEILYKRSTLFFPQRLSLLGVSSHFRFDIPIKLQQGTKVSLTFHTTPLKDGSGGDCQNNQTVNYKG